MLFLKEKNQASNIECNICGKNVPRLFKAEIEGTVLEVCESCLSFGEKIIEPEVLKRVRKLKRKPLVEEEAVFVDNYGKLIVAARKKMNLTREEFAKKINEKESVIKRVEAEGMRPNDALSKKIERFLEIKLTKTYEKKRIDKKTQRGRLTIGDVIEVE